MNGGTEVALKEDGLPLAFLELDDALRPTAYDSIHELHGLGLSVGILSGDNRSAVFHLTRDLGIESKMKFPALSPERKAAVLKEFPRSLMVGDGANDALALATASVGMAMHGGMEVSMRAAGIYGASANLTQIPKLIVIARETMRIIRRNLIFTVLYNVLVVSIAISGSLKPIVAAVLMPLSSFTVFCISIAGTRPMRRALAGMSD